MIATSGVLGGLLLRANEAPSLLYFDHIARCCSRPEDFARSYLAVLDDDERVLRMIAEQTWAASVVARRKFRNVTPAIWALGTALVLSIVAGFLSTRPVW